MATLSKVSNFADRNKASMGWFSWLQNHFDETACQRSTRLDAGNARTIFLFLLVVSVVSWMRPNIALDPPLDFYTEASSPNGDTYLLCPASKSGKSKIQIGGEKDRNWLELESLASEGDANAQYLLGICLFAESNSEATYYFNLAAEQGHTGALVWIGMAYYEGRGVDKDLERGAKSIKAAARKGDSFAQHQLGVLYSNGEGVPQSYQEAEKWFRAAKTSPNFLGYIFESGEEVSLNLNEAFKWYFIAASENHADVSEHGKIESQIKVGKMFLHGIGVTQNTQDGVKWLEMAAKNNAVEAQIILGEMYRKGEQVKQDKQRAISWLEMAADRESQIAQYNLGLMHLYGEGIPQNPQTALKYLSRSARWGNANARYQLGLMHYYGEGIPQNPQEALRWIRLAASDKHDWAQYHLGLMFGNGEIVTKNYEEAVKWFTLSAKQGNSCAQSKLGYMHDMGLGAILLL